MEKFALWILKNSTVKIRPEADFKIRPAVLLCQNPSPGTSGYLEKIPRTGDGFSTRVLSLPPSLPDCDGCCMHDEDIALI